MRIIVANDPRAYREAITGAFQLLRPHATVLAIEPAALDREVVRLRPHLVVFSAPSAVVQDHAFAWVLLYPSGAAEAVISVGGQHTTVADLEFDRLLEVLDDEERLA